ncbi:hypothetical protein B0H10DRAFT_2059385 [Mycena sp. CBHHK59/15]|nr:hypothetical protein B0H10DRAFT_2059385 [Mycena sp. CBHHK59/15]
MKPLILLLAVAAAVGAHDSAVSLTTSSSIPPTSLTSTSDTVGTTPSDTASNTQPTSTPPPTGGLSVSQSLTTNSAGDAVTVNTSSTAAPSNSSGANNSSSSTLSTGGIIGLSVAGGVAVIFLSAFAIWKFRSKRMRDFDDNENIKWPELNDHSGPPDSHALPVHNTGRAGFDTASDLSRTPSAANTYTASSTDLHGEDPYAVPPLPHLNPLSRTTTTPPPRRLRLRPTFNEAHGAPPPEWGQTEAIPMTQMRTASPAPYDAGRASPGPQAAYGGGRASPGPQAAYGGGRVSPGPQAAYGGRASPGPQAVYGGGRVSPGPQVAYGAR